ncbi:MAG: RIP metalloprotease RseP [Bacteroidales bacterium]|nr:RIP metalloprotease RseP [Bacteroidales bacterium]
MDILIKTAQLLLSLSLLVVIHEFGHFIFARLFKTRVEKFYIFFDPWFSLFKMKKGDTEYGVGWLPLGGYVKIAGMIDESMDKEAMKLPPQPYEFRSKPSGQRLLIMLGGVMFNVIFAFLVYSMVLFSWGDTYLPTKNLKYGIICDSLALNMGLQHGDKILTLDNKEVVDFHDVVPEIVYSGAKTIQVDRGGQVVNIPIPGTFVSDYLKVNRESKGKSGFIYFAYPFVVKSFVAGQPAKHSGMQVDDRIIGINGMDLPYFDLFRVEIMKHKGDSVIINIDRNGQKMDIPLLVSKDGTIGAYTRDPKSFFELQKVHYGFFASFPAGVKKGISTISSYLKDLKLIFTPQTEAYKSLGGFIAIGNIFPASWSWYTFWNMTAFLSIMLAVLNILPIPALDGGHVFFLLGEIITGKKPSDRFMEVAQIIGMLILLALVLYANGNDIVKLFQK